MLIHPAMLIHLDKDGPLHRQLYDKLKSLILTGGVTPGARLPSSRQLAGDLSVSRNTVLIAYEQLAAEGYLEARHGSGTFVSPVLAAAEAADHAGLHRQGRPPAAHGAGRRSLYSRRLQALDIDALGPRGGFRYDFHYGTVNAADFPVAIWRRLMLREIRRRAGQPYPAENPQGLPELRAALCAYLARARAVRATPEQVLVVNGSQQAIDLAVRVLIDPDTPVVIEEPAYSGARLAFQAARARLLRVPVDEEGMVTGMLPPPGARPRLIYITPSHQFPTGGTMPVSRRLALLDWAKRSGAYIFEDDYDSEYRYEGRPVESIQALDRFGLVIYSGTVSKVLSPGLRLGYLVLPPDLVETFLRAKQLIDRHTASLDQAIFAAFIRDGHFERHIRRTRRRNQRRRDALAQALRATFGDAVEIEGAKAGLHVVVWFRDVPGHRAQAAADAAARHGIGLYPVGPHFSRDRRQAGFIVGYAALDEPDIRAGVALLGKVMRRFATGAGQTAADGSPAEVAPEKFRKSGPYPTRSRLLG